MTIICYQQSLLSLKDSFTVWRQSQKEDLEVWHGTNSIFFNNKNKDWTSRTLATLPPLHTLNSISFLPILQPPLKVDAIYLSPLIDRIANISFTLT